MPGQAGLVGGRPWDEKAAVVEIRLPYGCRCNDNIGSTEKMQEINQGFLDKKVKIW